MSKLRAMLLHLILLVVSSPLLAAQVTGAHIDASSSEMSEGASALVGEDHEEQVLSADPQARSESALVVRLSAALEPEARAAIHAVIETLPGVDVDENATHEIGPHPSIEEIIAIYELPGAIPRSPFSALRNRRGITSIDALFELYSEPLESQLATLSNNPPPIELGSVATDGFAERLRTALLGVARRAALIKFARIESAGTISVCLSNTPSQRNTCPLPRKGRSWNEVTESEPIYLAIEAAPGTVVEVVESGEISRSRDPAQDMRYFSVVAIGRDGGVTQVAAGEGVEIITKRIVRRDGQIAAASAELQFRFAPEAPLDGKLPAGFYDFLVLTTREPIPPGVWLDKADPRTPLEACPPAPWFDLCHTMNFGVRLMPFGWGDAASVQVAVVPEVRWPVRVVNGSNATRNLSLWQAQLLTLPKAPVGSGSRSFSFKDNHRCGGAYLGEGLVLTAAHCIPDNFGDLRVRLGSPSLRSGGATFRVATVVVHANGGSTNRRVDLALVLLDDPRRRLDSLGPDLQPVALATNPRPRFSNLNLLTATGWGLIKKRLPNQGWIAADGTTNSFSDVLQQARLSQLDTSICHEFEDYRAYLAQDMLCLIGAVRNTDTCQGDSGGPVTGVVGRQRLLVGIVSGGIGCAQDGVPAVYVNVAQHRGWIDRARQRILTSRTRGVLVEK